jgi:hypothetical protein
LGTRTTTMASMCADIVSLQRSTSIGSSWPLHTSGKSHQPLSKLIVLATTSLDCVGFANTERRYYSLNSTALHQILYHRRAYQHRPHAIPWQNGLATDVCVRGILFTLALNVFHTAENSGIVKDRITLGTRHVTSNT